MDSVVWGRTWTDSQGNTLEADFDRLDGNVVVLKLKAGGKVVRIPADRLTASDLKFAQQQANKGKDSIPGKPPVQPRDPPLGKTQTSVKVPVPGLEDQAKGEKFVTEKFNDRLTAATTSAQKLPLVLQLSNEAAKNRKTHGVCYALLKQACRTAAEGGDAELATKTAQQIADQFDANLLKMQAVLVAQAVAAGDATQSAKNAETAMGIAEKCAAAEEFEWARKAADAARAAATKSGRRELVGAVAKRSRLLVQMDTDYAKVKDAIAALDKDADNGEANGVVGQYKCFIKARWDEGLPLLAKGSDGKLAKLAAEELALPPGMAGDEVAARLAASWWEVGNRAEGTAKNNVRAHAAILYQRVLPNLTGAAKTNAEKRIAVSEAAATSSGQGGASGPLVNVRYDRLAPAGQFSLGAGETSVDHIRFSPDSRELLIPYRDAIYLADVGSRRVRPLVRPMTKIEVCDGVPCPDGQNFALAMKSGHVIICDPRGKILQDIAAHDTTGAYTGALGLGYSPDGSMLVTLGRGGMIRFWDAKTLERKGEIRSDPDNMCLDFQKVGPYLSTCCVHHGEVRLIEWRRPRLVKGFPPTTAGGAFSPDENRMALSGASMRVWDLKQNKVTVQLKNDGDTCLATTYWFPDGRHVLSGSQHSAQIWDTEKNQIVWRFPTGEATAESLALSPDGLVVALGLRVGKARFVQLWRLGGR
ncbi:MAG: hypothetical protein K8T91_13555 [Planctomycetes bacterium]|nr:hypothetical protein [Planctomycetota bacterium]